MNELALPNYSQAVENVFHDTARQMIADHDRTDVILLAKRTAGRRDLPTWVPDWANLKGRLPVWVEWCLDQNLPRLNNPNKVKHEVLQVRRTHLDTIVDFLQDEEPDNTHSPRFQTQPPPLLSESIVGNLTMGLCYGPEAIPTQITAAHRMMQMFDGGEDALNAHCHLSRWIFRNRHRRLGEYTQQQHVGAYISKHGSTAPKPDANSLGLARLAMTAGFERIKRFKMTFAVTMRGNVRIVHRDARVTDGMYLLHNCPLPVVLRYVGEEQFRYVGDTIVTQNFLSQPRQGKEENICII